MIIFTVTNKTTSQVYVGSTRNSLLDQWEKMVAAAEQNLDYPLYQEIRVHGPDAFMVEEWDYIENRDELNALEQEAIKTLSARSLKGYKTSTIKIQPKKKTRVRKSALEKELPTILSDVDYGMDDFDDITAAPEKQAQKASEPAPASTSAATVVAPPSIVVAAPAQSDKVAAPAQSDKVSEPQAERLRHEKGSQVNAVVQMSNICLSDDFSAQLEAIQAAANGVLAGDSSALELLNCPTPEPVEIDIEIAEPTEQTEPTPEPETDADVELDSRELRIRAAIARHRKARAQKTSDNLATERRMLEQQLAELTARASSNSAIVTAA